MRSKRPRRPSKATRNDVAAQSDAKPRLLAGGNPQIAKADGDAPVQAYIAAMPGWKSGVGRRLDDLIVRTVPNVRKAVRWNSPWYGIEGEGWFVSYHVFTRYIKVTFLNGAMLCPVPPVQGRIRMRVGSRHLRGRVRRGADGDVDPAGGCPARLARVLTSCVLDSPPESSSYSPLWSTLIVNICTRRILISQMLRPGVSSPICS